MQSTRWILRAGSLGLVVAVLTAPVIVHGQGRAGGGPVQSGPAARPIVGTGVIVGRVVEAGGNVPVAGALVRLSGGALGNQGGVFAAATGAGPRLVEVGASGQFAFTGLPKGSYNIDVTAPGYLPGEFGQERPRSPIPRALDINRQLDLGDGETKTDVTIHMFRLGVITGTVLDEYNQPAVGVDVHIQAVQEIWIGRISSNTDTVLTDDRGIYRAEVAPGDYIVGVGSATVTMPAAIVDEYQQQAANGDFQSGIQAGFAFNANGLPVPPMSGLRIGNLVVESRTQSRVGSWLWTSGDTGPVFVYPPTYYPAANLSTMATTISVDAGVERSGIDLQLRPQRAFRVSGHLMGPDGPVKGVGLRLIGADFNTKTSSPSLFVPVSATDASGAFTFMGITPGQYSLDVVKNPVVARQTTTVSVATGNGTSSIMMSAGPAAPSSEPVWWASQPVTVGNADVSDVVVTLAEGVRISGHFEFPSSAPPLTRQQIEAISVGVRVQPGTIAGRLSGNVAGAVTDDTGAFRSSELVPGTYLIVANRLPAGWSLQSAMVNGHDAADAPIDIGPEGLSNVVMTFTNKSTTLTGSVTGNDFPSSADGLPTPPPTVVIFSTNQNLWPKVALSPRTLRSVPCTPALTYRTTGMPAGEYYVAASSSQVDFTDPRVLLFLSKSASRVTLVEGESRAQDVHAVVVPAAR